jgi:hypothetical protein
MLADQLGLTQVVILVNQIIPQIALARGHHVKEKFAILAQCILERGITEKRNLSKGALLEVVLRSQARREINECAEQSV